MGRSALCAASRHRHGATLVVGRIDQAFGPRRALGLGGASGFAAAIVAFTYLVVYRHLRVCLDGDVSPSPTIS